jgi:hypothetical protein
LNAVAGVESGQQVRQVGLCGRRADGQPTRLFAIRRLASFSLKGEVV